MERRRTLGWWIAGAFVLSAGVTPARPMDDEPAELPPPAAREVDFAADVAPLLERLSAVTDLALVAYPNAGRAWDPLTGWQGQSRVSGDDLMRAWAEIDRVRFIGGCCGVGPAAIAGISRSLTSST